MKRRYSEPLPIPGDDDTPESTSAITAPSGFSVRMNVYGEHHAGAHHVHFTTSVPLEGVSFFRTTNGECFYDSALDRVFINDGSLILEIDPQTFQSQHKNPHTPWGFQLFERQDDQFRFVYARANGEPLEELVPYEEIFWHSGLGFAVWQRFPSAYIPMVLANGR